MPDLRNYQQQGVDDIRARFTDGARRVLYQAPTGFGKTVLFGFITQNAAARGNRVAILGHRQEIVDQIDTALTELAVPHGIIAAGLSRDAGFAGAGRQRSHLGAAVGSAARSRPAGG